MTGVEIAIIVVVLVLGIGLGIVSLVCGILGLVKRNKTNCILGIVFGAISLGGIGLAGLICGIVGLARGKESNRTKK
ncbi:MAG: hypothetical protein LBJ97_00895 [Mycoplasmataceae bacterium]|nr:hypothetical protein [Mycoplasmataceae bacterium]